MPSDAFDAWFARCLERDLSRRFVDAEEAWAALEPVLGAASRGPTPPALVAGPGLVPTELEPTRTLQGSFAFPDAKAPLEPTAAAPAGVAAFDARPLAPDRAERGEHAPRKPSQDSTPIAATSSAPVARRSPSLGLSLGAIAVVAGVGAFVGLRRAPPPAPAATSPSSTKAAVVASSADEMARPLRHRRGARAGR